MPGELGEGINGRFHDVVVAVTSECTKENAAGKWRERVCDLARGFGIALSEKEIAWLSSQSASVLHTVAIGNAGETATRLHDLAKALR